MESGWAGAPCIIGPTARSGCTRSIACWASRCSNTCTVRPRRHGPASPWSSCWRSCVRSRNLFSSIRHKVTRDRIESPRCSPSRPYRNKPWRRRWGWNNSVLPRVGNTMAGSQPIPKTTTYNFVPALRSKLPLDKLTRAWRALVFRFDPGLLRVNGKPVLVGDGIKVAKAGRKMPGVKKLHQESDSNTKPEYIFGPSCQAVAVLTQALSSVFALPLACRIHEGTVFSNPDHRTLLDKMILLLDSLDLNEPFYFVADAYYASGKIEQQDHLVQQ